MVCPGCGEKNRDGARFCTYCGTTLALRCPVCDNEVVAGGRFCDACGAAVDPSLQARPSPPATAAARKVVTVLFADLSGSTALEERMDAESVRSILDRFYAAMRAEVERFGGRVVKFTGDGVMAAFGVPDVHEDDAVRAVDAALAMREELEQLASDLSLDVKLNIGVNTGEVVVSDADDDVVGDAVNVAARLEGAATNGEILVGEETWRLTRATSRYEPVEPLTLKGKSEPVPAYRLLSVDERTSDSAAAPFVGRDAELGRLLAVFQDAVDANAARLVTIIGSPGLGKTRLARELMAELSDAARVRETRCDPAGESTFAPIAEALRAASGISELDTEEDVLAKISARFAEDDPDRDRIAARAAAILGVGQPGSTEETFWAIRRLIEEAAAAQPVVFVFDDIHWAEPLMLDLVEHLAEWIKTAPVLIVGTARPELRDLRPSLAEGGRAADVIALEGLNRSATAQLALNLLGADELPSELLAKIPASTQGNPLFVRELVRMLVDDGVLMRTAEGWSVTVDVDAIQVPPTITSLLSARVDRLRNDERTVVELASVVGKEFYRGALVELAPSGVKDLVDGCLESLRRKELVEPVGTYWIDERVYRFHHVLIRDAAYRRLLKESRADLHERVAGWLQNKTADVLGEHDELLGYHFEQAHEYKRQLGRPDDELGCRAAALLHTAAQRALDRDDLPAAAALSGRALDRLPLNDDTRPEVLLIRCEALLSMGDVARGAHAVSELDLVATTARLRAWVTCFSGHLANLTSPEASDDAEVRVAAAAAELAALGDQAGAAKAHTVRAHTLKMRGRFAECEAVLDDALTAARAANDRRRITATLGLAPHAQLWGPNVVSRAGGRCLDVVRLLRITTGSAAVEATSLRCQAVLEAFRGRADAARRMLRSSQRTLTELALEHELLEAEELAGIIELVDGDPAAAVVHFRASYEGFKAAGVDVAAGQLAAALARAHLLLGEDDVAASLLDESDRLSGHGKKAAIDRRAVKAELLARRGKFDEARRIAEEAVALASETDALFDHGMACRSLATVLRAAGDAAGAQEAEDSARALFERKGATALLGSDTASAEAPAGSALPQRRPLQNDCVVQYDRLVNAIRKRDSRAVADLQDADIVIDDRRAGLGSRDVVLAQIKVIADPAATPSSYEVVATRGRQLALVRATMMIESGRSVDVLQVVEIGPDGRFLAYSTFGPDDLDAAFVELDERYMRGEARACADQFRGVIAFIRHMNDRVWDEFRPWFTDAASVVDHTPAGRGEMTVDRFLSSIDELVGLTSELCVRATVVHAIRDGVTLIEAHNRGVSLDGADVDLAYQTLFVHSGGSIRRIELYPVERLGAVRARFEELVATRHGTVASTGAVARDVLAPAVENRSMAILREVASLVDLCDWEAFARLHTDASYIEDRRRGLGSVIAGQDAIVAFGKTQGEAFGTRDYVCVATRGERLALARGTWTSEDAASFDAEMLRLSEIDDDGHVRMAIFFDPDDLDAAFAELDARYERGEGAQHAEIVRAMSRLARAFTANDWEEARAALADDVVVLDHRPALLGEIHGADVWIDSAKELNSLVDYRADLIRYHALDGDAAVCEFSYHGKSNEGADVESAFHFVFQVRDGRIIRMEPFPVDQLAEALSRFRELSTSTQLENAAVRAIRESDRLLLARDWESLRAVYREDVVVPDLRPGLGSEVRGIEGRIGGLRAVAGLGVVRLERTALAIRGERLALDKTFVESADGERVEVLGLTEVDEDGRIASVTRFELEQFDDAVADLDARAVRLEGQEYAEIFRLKRESSRAISQADWPLMSSLLADDFVLVDHRPTGWGVRRGPDAFREVMTSAPDVLGSRQVSVSRFVRKSVDVALAIARVDGMTPDGLRFDASRLVLTQIADGVITRFEYFDADALDHALRRFDELCPPSGRGPLPLSNASARVAARFPAMLNARDWGAIERVYAPDVLFEDRRSGLTTSVRGREAQVNQMKVMAELGTRDAGETEVLATRGERLALLRGLWAVTGENDTVHEIETLLVQETDRDERISALIVFGAESLDAAYAELEARYIQQLGPRFESLLRQFVGYVDAYNARDWNAAREFFADDFVLVDHRPASLGTVGPDDFIQAVSQLAELGNFKLSIVALFRVTPHTAHARCRFSGVTEAGAAVELQFDFVGATRGDETVRLEFFPIDEYGAAATRFEEVSRTGPGRLSNAAVRAAQAFCDAFHRDDWDFVSWFFADGYEFDDRRPAMRTVVRGKDAGVQNIRQAADNGMRRLIYAPVAIRGDRLVLGHYRWGASDWDVDVLVVDEYDADGRSVRAVVFTLDDVDAAYAELNERHIATEGAPFALALRAMRETSESWNAHDWTRLGATFTADTVFVDRRRLGIPELRGRETIVRLAQSLLTPDMRHDVVAIHALWDDGYLVEIRGHGRSEAGGDVDVAYLHGTVLRGGQLAHVERFDVDQLDAALARFAEMRDGVDRAASAENAATRFVDRLQEAMDRQDMDGFISLHADDFVHDDRRAGIKHVTRGLDRIREYAQLSRELGYGTFRTVETLATRGERLCLTRRIYSDPRSGRDFETEQLIVDEVDAEGRVVRAVVFDPHAVDDAFIELNERYIAGDGRPFADVVRANIATMAAINRRDWDEYVRHAAEGFVFVDHRPASLGTVTLRELVEANRELTELIPNLSIRLRRYIALDVHRWVSDIVAVGHTSEGEPLDLSFVNVGQLRGEKVCRSEFFPVDRLDDALVRFDELGAERAYTASVENACTRHWDRMITAGFAQRDWVTCGDLVTDDVDFVDKRSGLGARVRGRATFVDQIKVVADMGPVVRCDIIATRGERLALIMVEWGDPDAGNALTVRALHVHELDDDLRLAALVVFDADDIDAALDDLEERFVAGEGAPYAGTLTKAARQRAALKENDWVTYRSLFADDVVLVDHRPASLGEIRGIDAVVDALRAYAPLMRDFRPIAVTYPALSSNRSLTHVKATATAAHGGVVEMAHLRVQQLRDGLVARVELFPVDRFDDARRRFDELSDVAHRGTESLTNAATPLFDIGAEAIRTDEWTAMRAALADDVLLEDRRRGIHSRGVDPEAWITNYRTAAGLGFHGIKSDVIATRGDRVALTHGAMEDDNGNMMDALVLTEVDQSGRATAVIHFDTEDFDGAIAELDARFAQAVDAGAAAIVEFNSKILRAYNVGDWGAFRSMIHENVVFLDHRPVSAGRIENAEEWLRYLQTMPEMTSSYRAYLTRYYALAPGRALVRQRNHGTSLDGVDFDIELIVATSMHHGRLASIEFFLSEQFDEALERFAAAPSGDVRDAAAEPSPSRLENICTRTWDAMCLTFAERRWDAHAKRMAPDVVFEDRRPGLQNVVAGLDDCLEVAKAVADIGPVLETKVLAVRGDRLALFHEHYHAAGDEPRDVHVELLNILEVDAQGRIARATNFEVDDIDEAFAELDERFVAGEAGDAVDMIRLGLRTVPVWNGQDWDALAALWDPDMIFVDHRQLSPGDVRRDELLLMVQSLAEMIPDVRHRIVAMPMGDRRVVLTQIVAEGTNTEGGRVDFSYLQIACARDGRYTRIERFELDRFDDAVARYEELRRSPPDPDRRLDDVGPRPDDDHPCMEWMDRRSRLIAGDDWDSITEMYAEDVVLEDRRRGLEARIAGRDAVLDHARTVSRVGATMEPKLLASRGGRLALVHGTELLLHELDTDGRQIYNAVFDPHDLDAAFDQLDERYRAGDGRPYSDILRIAKDQESSYNERDWTAYRSRLRDDVAFVDHRAAGAGEFMGAERLIGYLQGLIDLASDARLRTSEIIAVAPDRLLGRHEVRGSTAEGAEIELAFYVLYETRDDRLARTEVFPFDERHRAVARFEGSG